ncbi:hypothetical protein MMC34_004658 [Xylographa carneopallida]|nr:hypothetical protein [Xylographa carneopallida]
MTGSSLKNLSILRSICGMKNLPHVMLATTMWPLVTTEQGNKREAELISTSHFWGSMKSADPIIRRYDNTRGGAIAMVDELLQMSPIVLQIQEEMAVRKMALIDTEAGQKVNIDLKTLEKKHKEELEEVRKELILVAAEEDNDMRKHLQAMEKKLVEQLNKVEMNRKTLVRPLNQRA